MLNYEKHLWSLRTVSTSKVSSSLMLKRWSSSRWGHLSHRPQSSLHQEHSPGRLSSSEYDISYVHNSNIKRLQLNMCTKKPKLDHYYSSRVDYRFVESFLENSQLTWCIHSTVGDGRSSFHPRVHYAKMSSTREWRRSDPHDNNRDSSSSHIYMVETLPHWFLSDICDHWWWSLLLLPLVHNKGLAPREEGEMTPRQQLGFFGLDISRPLDISYIF